MRLHLLTKNLICCLLCFGLLSLNGIARAQVYKSYDANGNVIFSDTPTKRSSEVEITTPNVSDTFDIPPPTESPPESKPEAKPEPEPATQPNVDYDPADTNFDGRVSRREKEDERKERRKQKREAAEAVEGYEE